MTPIELNSILNKPSIARRNPMLKPDGFVNLSPVISVMESPHTAEQQLHHDIMEACERRGWLYFHGAMCKRTHRTAGEPDFIIVAQDRILLVECKSRTGKLSVEQQGVAAHAAKLGHTVHVVRCMQDFFNLV